MKQEVERRIDTRGPGAGSRAHGAPRLGRSAHVDTFARDSLPPRAEWPELTFDLPELRYPDRLNCAHALLAGDIARRGDAAPAILQGNRAWSLGDLLRAVDRYAWVLTQQLGLRSGARVLLRGGNTPELFACWLAVVKAGGVAVTTMPLLRAHELRQIVEKARIEIALCEAGLEAELALAAAPDLRHTVIYAPGGGELEGLAARHTSPFPHADTSQDDVCLIAFTSGTTGEPKAAMHFHRDVMSMCHTYARHRLPMAPGAVFCGTPPIGFTFGLGALLAFPLYLGAAVALPDGQTPSALARAIARHRATHIFTSPTGYRALLDLGDALDASSVRVAVSAGEHLSEATAEAWRTVFGFPLLDGIGATEMIHIFIANDPNDVRPGSVGKAVPGYEVALLDADGVQLSGKAVGRLAVRGPVGCRYLRDTRQSDYVQQGWNVTGDIFRRDPEGFYWFVGRADDMIVSSGYNIAGAEVEGALLAHPAVAECAVVGVPDAQRGQVVKAFVVPRSGHRADTDLVQALQDHVKSVLAPYKYPRAVAFVDALPRTTTGKLSRRALRAPDAAGDQP